MDQQLLQRSSSLHKPVIVSEKQVHCKKKNEQSRLEGRHVAFSAFDGSQEQLESPRPTFFNCADDAVPREPQARAVALAGFEQAELRHEGQTKECAFN